MNIFGKLIGGILGFLFGHIFGMLVGIWIGHFFDKGLKINYGFTSDHSDPQLTQAIFFEASFAVMGHIAKADGVVTKAEIAAAEQVIRHLGLVDSKRDQAIAAFSRGKSVEFNLDQELTELLKFCARSPSLIQMFLEFQILAATADGHPSQPEVVILYRIGQRFGLPRLQIDRLIDMVIAQRSFHRDSRSGRFDGKNQPSLEQAYQVIGVDQSADKQAIKKAYRKLMAQHHPDKLVAKGMPEEMIKVATEKSQEIQAAYEMIKNAKGF